MAVEDRGPSCGQPTNFGGTGGMFAESLARRISEGIELLPRPPGDREAGRLGDEDPHDVHQLAGAWRSGWVTRPLGPEETSASTGSVTGTGHPKGPCDSYPQGPFTISGSCRAGCCRELRDPGETLNPAQPWGKLARTCGVRAAICGTPGQFRWNQKNVSESSCAAVRGGHRTSPTPSGRPGGGATRRRGSTRCRASLLGTHRGGKVTRPPGPEWKRCRLGASPVPVE